MKNRTVPGIQAIQRMYYYYSKTVAEIQFMGQSILKFMHKNVDREY